MPYRYPSDPLNLLQVPRGLRSTILFGLTLVFSIAVIGLGAAQANSGLEGVFRADALTCMPAITGIASSADDMRARSKATWSWMSRVEETYGRGFVDVNLTRGASWQCGRTRGGATTCQVAAQPCRLDIKLSGSN